MIRTNLTWSPRTQGVLRRGYTNNLKDVRANKIDSPLPVLDAQPRNNPILMYPILIDNKLSQSGTIHAVLWNVR